MRRSEQIKAAREQFLTGIGVPEKGEFIIDGFQSMAINEVAAGNDTLVVAPTGSGKTFIAFEAIAMALELKCRSVYTTPLKALSNTKYTELKNRFEPQYKVGLLTGDRKIDGDASVVVATTEIYRNELYRSPGQFSIIVLDEIHFLADPQRGPVWEESIILTPPEATLLMLSASISNPTEIAAWIESVRGRPCSVVTHSERPVELRWGFMHPNIGVLPLREKHGQIFKEVLSYYGSSGLDSSGMKLKGGRDRRKLASRRPQRRQR